MARYMSSHAMFSQDIDARLVAAINDNPDPNAELLAMVILPPNPPQP